LAELLIAIRWLHVLFGTTWVGLLYSSNLKNAQAAAFGADGIESQRRAPLWLGGFPWSAGGTVLFGAVYLALVERRRLLGRVAPNPYEIAILTGSALGLIMFVNAIVFWLARKPPAVNRRIGAPAKFAFAANKAEQRAMLATRTNVVLSIPMLFFMTAASHYRFVPRMNAAQAAAWFATVGGAIAVLELNVIFGLSRIGRCLLEPVRGAIVAGFALWGLFFAIIKMFFA
jgi:uncharacterized membrane protein